ncbi:MAG: FadR/GntR family transcriptional regulator [Desulfobacter sp.]
MKEVFQEIRVDKVSDKVAEQLENLIKDGKLTPGDKLPGERELIDILGVGRSSLREALNKLHTLGYVDIVKRKGVFVKSIDSAIQLDPLRQMVTDDLNKIIQLYDVRRDIEQANAFTAAKERTDKDIDEIEACLGDLEFNGSQGSTFSWAYDQTFHCAIARATQNIFRIQVILNIFDFTRAFIRPVIEELAGADDNALTIARQHQAIFQAVKDQNPDAARRKMGEHLSWTNRQFIDYFNRTT